MSTVKIYDGNNFIDEITFKQISDAMGLNDKKFKSEFFYGDFDMFIETIASNSFTKDCYSVDIAKLARESLIDAKKTNTVFWLMNVLLKSESRKKFSPSTVRLIEYPVNAKLTASNIRLDREASSMNAVDKFLDILEDAAMDFYSDSCSADECADRLYEALPPAEYLYKEIKRFPKLRRILTYAQRICMLSSNLEAQEFFEEILGDDQK